MFGGKPESIIRIEKLTGKNIEFVKGDLLNCKDLRDIFSQVRTFKIFRVDCTFNELDLISILYVSVQNFLCHSLCCPQISCRICGGSVIILYQ